MITSYSSNSPTLFWWKGETDSIICWKFLVILIYFGIDFHWISTLDFIVQSVCSVWSEHPRSRKLIITLTNLIISVGLSRCTTYAAVIIVWSYYMANHGVTCHIPLFFTWYSDIYSVCSSPSVVVRKSSRCGRNTTRSKSVTVTTASSLICIPKSFK